MHNAAFFLEPSGHTGCIMFVYAYICYILCAHVYICCILCVYVYTYIGCMLPV